MDLCFAGEYNYFPKAAEVPRLESPVDKTSEQKV
jgi:hypothetical protein